jgi:polysaccharide deacetylase family protein (PEP-CTERM system associated)
MRSGALIKAVINALSVDIEDWYQVGAFENTIARKDWGACASRVERNTDRLIDLFARKNVRATFFTLGWVAERHPDLIRRIVAGGHELASHGYDHQRVFTFTPEQFRADLRKSRALLEQAGRGAGARLSRAELLHRRAYALAHAVLAEEGYSYSSSVAPVRHDHYGWPEAPRFAFRPLADSAADRAAGDDGAPAGADDRGRGRRLLPPDAPMASRAGRWGR